MTLEGILAIQAGDNPRVVAGEAHRLRPAGACAPTEDEAAAAAERREGGRVAAWPRRRHKKRGHHEEEHENEERWLVSFADMMTLLFCLFMVLFAISSVNTSQVRGAAEVAPGRVLGRDPLRRQGRHADRPDDKQPENAARRAAAAGDARRSRRSREHASSQDEQTEKAAPRRSRTSRRSSARIDKLGREGRGLDGQRRRPTVRQRGLVDPAAHRQGLLRLRPGRAQARRAATCSTRSATIVARRAQPPGRRRGPHRLAADPTSQYPSNWELSGARAAAVVRDFVADGVLARPAVRSRGYGAEGPIATNSTAAGPRAQPPGRVVLTRLHHGVTRAWRRNEARS